MRFRLTKAFPLFAVFLALAAPALLRGDECGWRRIDAARVAGPSVAESFAYNLAGLVSYTNSEGRVYRMSYDALGRITGATNALGECVFEATYDGAGNLLSRTDGEGRTVSYAYDPCGRVVSRTDSAGSDLFAYNPCGNVVSASNGNAAYLLRESQLGGLVPVILK